MKVLSHAVTITVSVVATACVTTLDGSVQAPAAEADSGTQYLVDQVPNNDGSIDCRYDGGVTLSSSGQKACPREIFVAPPPGAAASSVTQYLVDQVPNNDGGIDCRYDGGATLSSSGQTACPRETLVGPQGTLFDAGSRVLPDEPELSPRDRASLEEYIGLIENDIRRNWTPPASAPSNLECEVGIRVDQTGLVTEWLVRADSVESCEGIIDAVLRSSPLSEPPGSWVSQHRLELVIGSSG